MKASKREDVDVLIKGDELFERGSVRNLEMTQFEVWRYLNLNCERFMKMEVN